MYDDYDDYECSEPTQEEYEEMDGMGNTKVEAMKENIKIEFNTENFASGIVSAVASEVKKNIYQEIVSEIKKDVLDDIKEKIQLGVHQIIKEIIEDFMENDKVVIGNSIWDDDEPRQELTLKQYSKKCIKDCIEKSTFKVVTSIEKDRYSNSGYKAKTSTFTFDEYLQSNLGIGNETKAYFDAEIDKIRKQVNSDVKNAFDESTRTMLSNAVLNVLMANDTYKKIESNISSIASK